MTIAKTVGPGEIYQLCGSVNGDSNGMCAGVIGGEDDGQIGFLYVTAYPREEFLAPRTVGQVGTEYPLTPENSGIDAWPFKNEAGEWPENALLENALVAVGWFQPKEAMAYTIPRFVAGDLMTTFTTPYTVPEEGQ